MVEYNIQKNEQCTKHMKNIPVTKSTKYEGYNIVGYIPTSPFPPSPFLYYQYRRVHSYDAAKIVRTNIWT